METFDIYKDIAERTKGDVYLGEPVIIGLNQWNLVLIRVCAWLVLFLSN